MFVATMFAKCIIISWLSPLLLAHGSHYMLRTNSEVDIEAAIKNITGISEMQCLHKCRRDPRCKNSAYVEDSDHQSMCLFLNETKSSTNGDVSAKLHTQKTRT